ncbi:hypothetical protein D9758_012669 [Tetrapyrgos nigripes]|uniref:Uncharacterized protein n=1 Tax=Tetrapyrgos nigripes TaxID=182062 RepID=A0A8H5LMX4_9AGAR|nr:hypothetical protein D9758_012669 [Tetrapyrgos nigripes]
MICSSLGGEQQVFGKKCNGSKIAVRGAENTRLIMFSTKFNARVLLAAILGAALVIPNITAQDDPTTWSLEFHDDSGVTEGTQGVECATIDTDNVKSLDFDQPSNDWVLHLWKAADCAGGTPDQIVPANEGDTGGGCTALCPNGGECFKAYSIVDATF